MQQPTDPSNNYRCSYTGPGNLNGYYDIGHSVMVDACHNGCNYTATNGHCGNSYGCIGTAAPGAFGVDGDVYYNRASGGQCYYNSAGTWLSLNSGSLTPTQLTVAVSNSPGLPVLSNLNQNNAWSSCTATSKRLPSLREMIAASAWSPSLTNSQIVALETDTASNGCNTTNAPGLTFDTLAVPADLETISEASSSGKKVVRSGSNYTSACVSRYGVQDAIGNVYNFTSDLINCNSSNFTCVGIAALDPNNTDLVGFPWDGNVGPGNGGVDVSRWIVSTEMFSATEYLVPFGIPVLGSTPLSYSSMVLGTGVGQFNPAQLNGAKFWLESGTNGIHNVAQGGYWNVPSTRFQVNFFTSPTTTNYSGFHCAAYAD